MAHSAALSILEGIIDGSFVLNIRYKIVVRS